MQRLPVVLLRVVMQRQCPERVPVPAAVAVAVHILLAVSAVTLVAAARRDGVVVREVVTGASWEAVALLVRLPEVAAG